MLIFVKFLGVLLILFREESEVVVPVLNKMINW